MLWENLTSKQHAAVSRSVPVILPIASIEQHGPALPLCTDSLIGWELCLAAEKQLGEGVLLLPQVKVCYSQHHTDFAGSLTVSHEALIAYLTDIIASVIQQGFQNMLIFNSHGGNQGLMQVVLEKMGNAHKNTNIVAASWWRLCADELAQLQESSFMGNGHAAEFEFSLLEYLRPELVDYPHKSAGAIPQMPLPQAEGDLLQGGSATLLRTFAEMTADGTYGLTDKASTAKGEKVFAAASSRLEQLVLDLQKIGRRSG